MPSRSTLSAGEQQAEEAIRSVLGGGLFALFAIIGVVSWVDLARLVRAQALSLREREFVEAARSLGATDREIIMRHILPNTLAPITWIYRCSAAESEGFNDGRKFASEALITNDRSTRTGPIPDCISTSTGTARRVGA